MLAKINAGDKPGTPTLMTEEDFRKGLYRTTGENKFCTNPEAEQWSRGGRMGSHWQIADAMYVKIKDGNDDPFNYYSPPDMPKSTVGNSWGDADCCGSAGRGASSCSTVRTSRSGCKSGCSC